MDAYPHVGEIVAGRYRIEALLGEGGMGAVFRAVDANGTPFALKFPAPEIRQRPGMMSRFANEAQAAARIASEHAVHIFGVEATETGVPFIVMEYLQGVDLDRVIEAQAPIDVPRAVHFALQILRALQVAHAAGVVHRDMKPSNCLVIPTPHEPELVKLIDFGITKILGDDAPNMTRTSVTMGTPAYMAPEQARSAKAAEPRSDLYSVGVILYELLTKRRPFEGDSGNELVVKICTEPPLPILSVRPDLPPGLASAIERALVKNASSRFANAAAFADALKPFSDARSAAVIARIESGTETPPALPNGARGGTAVMEPPPGAPWAAPGAAAAPGAGQRTILADAPLGFDPGPAAPGAARPGATVVGDAPIIPDVPGAPEAPSYGPPVAAAVPPAPPIESMGGRRSSSGGGRGGLIAILGVAAVALIGTGIYLAVAGSSGSSDTASSTPATSSDDSEDDESDESTSKKKKKKTSDDQTTAEADEPEPEIPPPTPAAATVAPKPTTTTTTTATTTTDAGTTSDAATTTPEPAADAATTTPEPADAATTSDPADAAASDAAAVPTSTVPILTLPPGFPKKPGGATTTTATATTTATTTPPATSTTNKFPGVKLPPLKNKK